MMSGNFTFPTAQALAVWFRTLRQPSRLWAGTLRIWQTEVASARPSSLRELLTPFTNKYGSSPEELAQRYGLEQASIADSDNRTGFRTTVNFLDLPSGPQRIDLKGLYLPAWPLPVDVGEVPPVLHQPSSTGGLALHEADWHTVPVIRALAFIGAAARIEGSIYVYALKPSAGTLVSEPLFQLDPEAFGEATEAHWRMAWRGWCADQRDLATEPSPMIANGYATIPSHHPNAVQLKALDELMHNEAWLSAGETSFREIASVRLTAGS